SAIAQDELASMLQGIGCQRFVPRVSAQYFGILWRPMSIQQRGRTFDMENKPRQIPAMPLFNKTFTSTRRFCARPSLDALDTAGWYSPIATGATMCRTGTLQFWIR